MTSFRSFPSQTVLITGASNGLGKHFAEIFAREGYALILVARSLQRLEKLSEELTTRFAIPITVLQHDLARPESAQALYADLQERRCAVHILINNAGFGEYGPFMKQSPDTLAEMLQLNISTLTQLTSLLLPQMLERGSGKILNVSSMAGFQSMPNFAVYAASKAYVLNFTEALHHELRHTGVSVTALCPGPTHTGFAQRAHAEDLLLFKWGMNAEAVAKMGYRALMKNRTYCITGSLNRIVIYLARLLPSRRLSLWVLGRLFRN